METMYDLARESLKESLKKCTEKQQLFFKRMYSHNNLDKPIEKVVEDMPEEKLNWAMQQAQRSIENLSRKQGG